MGWWEQSSSHWQACIVAQVGAAEVVGGGAFFLQFRATDIPVRPNFVALTAGIGIGGSVGSAITVPWADMLRQVTNRNFHPDTGNYGWSELVGTFSCQDVHRSRFTVHNVGASAVIVGAQVCNFVSTSFFPFGTPHIYFRTDMTIPRTLRAAGQAAANLPQMQGALGAGAFAFTGAMLFVGT